jgi:tripartite-type tricarboxylate transporter receptor subunit TctC
VTGLAKGGQILVVNSESPTTTMKDLLALAKKQPGNTTFGSGSSSSRIAGEPFQQMACVQLLHVPYNSNTFAFTDLLGKQNDMMITDSATGLPHVNSGKLRALAVSSRSRSTLLSDTPTIDEASVKGNDIDYWCAAYGPTKTPQPVVKKLNQMLTKAAKSPAAATFYNGSGTEAFTTSPDELARFQAEESKKWGIIIEAANIEKNKWAEPVRGRRGDVSRRSCTSASTCPKFFLELHGRSARTQKAQNTWFTPTDKPVILLWPVGEDSGNCEVVDAPPVPAKASLNLV